MIQFPTNMPKKAAKDALSTWSPATHMGDLDGVLPSWLQPGLDLAIAAI